MTNTFAINLAVEDHQIDFQNIVANFYYPKYFQECRHRFLKEKMGIDVPEYAERGLNFVIVEYKIKFLRPLKRGDHMTVTCDIIADPKRRIKALFSQKLYANDVLCAEADFIGTCVPANGGRPFIPQEILNYGTKR